MDHYIRQDCPRAFRNNGSRPLNALEKIQHVGSISVGKYAPTTAADYASGTNHVLPSGGMQEWFQV
ncbi:MAG: histidinol dehydrogenase [Gammaproteobacteria bacterium]|nr:histidinol dehydrogenase [Gammaproteobacteria bacterium]